MREPRWLDLQVILALHEESAAAFGGAVGIRDPGLLESALARPKNLFFYEENDDLGRLAAAYGHGISRNHPFLDGNKRCALLAVAVFLAINGCAFDPDELDEVKVMLSLASGELEEGALAAWIRANMR